MTNHMNLHRRRGSEGSGGMGGGALPDADTLADALEADMTGITLTEGMCTLMATLSQVRRYESVRLVSEDSSWFHPSPPVIHTCLNPIPFA